MRTLALLFVVAVSGCGMEESEPVSCTGVRPMVCHCVFSCISTKEQVIVEGDGFCEPLCYDPS